MKKKKKSLSSLKKKLDRVFSQWVRLRDADEGGTVECCTCKKLLFWKEAHAGHWISRRHMSTRYTPENVHAQCARCNLYEQGAGAEYAQFILRKYGHETFETLLAEKRQVKKWTPDELQDLIDLYEGEVSRWLDPYV